MLCPTFVKFGRREISKIMRCLSDKKTKFRLVLQPLLLSGSRPKSARASLRECTQNALEFIQMGLLFAELFPNAWRPSKRARKWIQDSAEVYLR